MAFRIPSQKRFAPNARKVVARKASIPASLAKQPGTGPSSSSTPGRKTQPGQSSQSSQSSQPSQPSSTLPEPSPTPGLTQDDGLPPSIGSTWGPPTIGASQPVAQPDTQPSSSFREPSLPSPSRKRAASPAPSNASKSSRTGGRPTMIHLAASSGPARRPTPSPSPAPTSAQQMQTTSDGSANRPNPSPSPVPQAAQPSPSPLASSAPLPRVSPSPQSVAPRPTLTAPRPPSRISVPPKRPTPAPTPTPPIQFTGLPPIVSSGRAPSEPAGLPPMVGSSFIDPVLVGDSASEPPVAGPSRPLTTEEYARALVAEVAAQPGPSKKPQPVLTRHGQVKKKPGPPKGRKAKNANEPRAPRRQRTPEYDEDGNIVRVPRAPYGSKGKAGTDKDKRLRKNRTPKPKDNQVDGEEVDEFAEDEPIDLSQQTMKSFTTNFYDGDMTERALKLKEAQREKQEAAKQEKTEFERFKRIRLQPLRRRERAKRNEDKAQRRLEWEAAGAKQGQDEVSDDELDSTDEEYDFEPDRLTPPGTPEPVNFDGEGGEGEDGVRGDEDIEEGLGDVAEYREDEDEDEGAEVDDQDYDAVDVNLADLGFTMQEDGEEGGEGGVETSAGEGMGEDDAEFSALFDNDPDNAQEMEYNSDGEPNFSFADYAANMENRRTQALATQNTRFVVTEDDDELRMTNSTSWKQRMKIDKWTDDETETFYSALSEVGENYGLIKTFFPYRSVAQVKKKGLRENARNPERVTEAIYAKRPIGKFPAVPTCDRDMPGVGYADDRKDDRYLKKSAGYDPDRPWDKEEALFAEAKRDMERLKAEDRGEAPPEYDDMVGEPDHDHDDFFGQLDDFDPAEGGDGDNQDQEQSGQAVEHEVQGEEAGDAETTGSGQAVPAVGAAEEVNDGALFLPGGDLDDDA